MRNLRNEGSTRLVSHSASEGGRCDPAVERPARSLSYEAFVYSYPLVTMEVTRRQQINIEADERPGFGPPNEFHHLRAFPSAEFRAVVRPNFDTLYSSAWLDLTAGPVIVHAPNTADRYYTLPMLDMWTDVFANPGKRTTGTGAADFSLPAPAIHCENLGPRLTGGPSLASSTSSAATRPVSA